VRLGARLIIGVGNAANEFQFQLGAIGRTEGLALGSFTSQVSIPAWCDWEFVEICAPFFYHILFQFQLGAIGRIKNVGMLSPVIAVSIPAWCDWEPLFSLSFWSISPVSIPAWCDWEYSRSYIT